jgi:hypothetical protein
MSSYVLGQLFTAPADKSGNDMMISRSRQYRFEVKSIALKSAYLFMDSGRIREAFAQYLPQLELSVAGASPAPASSQQYQLYILAIS